MKTVICVDLEGKQYEVDANELRWRPSAYAVVIRNGKLLLAKEASGSYGLPGGGIELGELPQDAVLREVKEETGIIVAHPKPLSFASNFFALTGSSKDKYVESLLLYYRCEFVGGELSLQYLPAVDRPFHDAPEWLPLEQLGNIKLASSFDWRPLVQSLTVS